MFLTRLRSDAGTFFGFSSRAIKMKDRVNAKHTGTAWGFTAASAVARRATLCRTRKAVCSPLRVAGALVGDGGAYDLARPSCILVCEDHPRSHVGERVPGPSVALQGRPDLPVGLPEGPTARGSKKAVGEACGAGYGRVGEGADVDGELIFRAWFERQVFEAPAPALVAGAPLLEGLPDHLDPLFEERGSVLPFVAQSLELVLHVPLADPEHEPPARYEVGDHRVLRHPQRVMHREKQHV